MDSQIFLFVDTLYVKLMFSYFTQMQMLLYFMDFNHNLSLILLYTCSELFCLKMCITWFKIQGGCPGQKVTK